MSGRPRFIQYLEKNGYFASVISATHVEELGAEIRALHDQDLLDDSVYNDYKMARFSTKLPKNLPHAKSIIILTTPQPMLRATFNWKGQARQLVVPPTYFDYGKVAWHARRLLAEAFRPRSYRFVRAILPLKLLAVRSGLALYGRNNITYLPNHGSFHRPTAFYTDYDSPVDYWQEKKALPLCAKCTACLKACPTGAIKKDRFLIRAEVCLTYLNEKGSKHKFPSWVDALAHNSLIGCMRCQLACPYDRGVVQRFEDRGEFTEEETAFLLKGRYSGPMAEKMTRKLKPLGLDLSTFPRNLQVLLDSQR